MTNEGPKVLLGEDTRESSAWVTSWLAGGLKAAGVEAVSAGVLPTPGVARLVAAKGFAAGVVVSASHNPYRDNGIKLIGANGMKLADEVEAEIEERIHELLGDKPHRRGAPLDSAPEERGLRSGSSLGFASLREDAEEGTERAARSPVADVTLAEEYRELLKQSAPKDLSGMHLVVDCANGAAVRTAPK
ncbi:MAG: hypothetical protein ACRD5I_00670, partial [Candidatus Acidiferrales bacterium]